jgi:hypothetical protein
MLGDRASMVINNGVDRFNVTFFEGITVEDILTWQIKAVAAEFRLNKTEMMRLAPKREREVLIKLGVDAR